ncbi:MAG: CapA family protein [Pseudomonadota bacterium]|nr:CapA family protein [Pseudomonadota bacterium]
MAVLAALLAAWDPVAAAGPAGEAGATPPTSTDLQRRHVVITAVGDTGFGSHLAPVLASGGHKHGRFQTWGDALSSIAGEIDGDFNFANLETVVTARNDLPPVSKAYNFRTHPDAVRYLAQIGFNLFSTANNHAFDYGRPGLLETLDNMDALGPRIAHAGVGRNLAEAAAARQVEAGGARIAFAAIGIGAGHGGAANARPDRPGQLAVHHRGDVDLMLDNLAAADADYRIVSVHSGKERLVVPLPGEIALWRDTALASGAADLVLVHHAHVARPVAMVGGRVVFFGLGNFAHFGTANMNGAGICRDFSMLARIHLLDDVDGVLRLAAIEIVPIRSTHIRPERFEPEEGRRRIAVLNGLAALLDAPERGATGLRFTAREDGTGLFCTELGSGDAGEVGQICTGYDGVAAELRGIGRCCLSAACAAPARRVTKVSSEPARTRPRLPAPFRAGDGNARRLPFSGR